MWGHCVFHLKKILRKIFLQFNRNFEFPFYEIDKCFSKVDEGFTLNENEAALKIHIVEILSAYKNCEHLAKDEYSST